ncbi:MAG: peptidoglycan binding domain-containing protein, partial [Bacillota bacterium]|nr:peptidoglycan binding domain-containing protein [Bacillota bacterium]
MLLERMKELKYWLFIISLCALVFTITMAVMWLMHLPEDKIAEGVMVGNVDMGLQTKAAGTGHLTTSVQELMNEVILLSYQGNMWSISPKELGYSADIIAAVEAAWEVGRRGPWWQQLKERISARLLGKRLELKWQVDEARFYDRMFAIAEAVERPAENAYLINSEDQIEIRPSLDGIRINKDKLLQELLKDLEEERVEDMELMVVAEKAEFTTDDIQALGINTLVGKFTTSFNVNLSKRVHNIQTAANSIDGLLIAPGEEFSFNDATGPRSLENGYKEAPVIVDNELSV